MLRRLLSVIPVQILLQEMLLQEVLIPTPYSLCSNTSYDIKILTC